MSQSFMQRQVTKQMEWIQLEGSNGMTFIPREDAPTIGLNVGECTDEDEPVSRFEEYYEGEIYDVSVIVGYGARLSAPGYMDCTEWSVFDTAEEAEKYLEETYGEEDEDEDSATA